MSLPATGRFFTRLSQSVIRPTLQAACLALVSTTDHNPKLLVEERFAVLLYSQRMVFPSHHHLASTLSHVQILYLKRMFLNELSARFYIIAHERRE